MKLIEGSYYETVSGVVVGPMVAYDAETTLPYFASQGNELKALNCNGEDIGTCQKWEPNGKVYAGVPAEDGHVIIREVPAPFRLEDGKAYVTASGDVVTVKEKEGYFVSSMYMHYRGDGKCCFEGNEDQDKEWLKNNPGHDIVGAAPSTLETLTIKIDSKDAQEIIEEAAKDFDAAAHKLLSEMADIQEELRAAKDAFNVLHREKKALEWQHANQRDTIRKRGEEIDRLNLAIQEKSDRIKRAMRVTAKSNARNSELSRKNGALGIEVLRLSERNHELLGLSIRDSDRILKGNNRLRRDRAKLKAERARSAAFEERAKDAEEQLRMYSSGKIVARNGSILFVVLAAAVAAGGFLF